MDPPECQKPSVRTSKKRNSEEDLQLATGNKRAVLDEITNSLIFSSNQCSLSDQEMTDKHLDEEKLPEGRSVDCSKKSGSASSIYNQLRLLEVWISASVSWFFFLSFLSNIEMLNELRTAIPLLCLGLASSLCSEVLIWTEHCDVS